jgi:hypothetical protein
MSAIIYDVTETPIEVPIRITPEGYVDAICRSETRAAWNADVHAVLYGSG